jgi:hypothetical protein
MNYKDIFNQANIDAKALTLAECGDNIMIYPCGFAWISLRNGIKGKRNPLGKELEADGLLSYDDYRKCYYYWVGDYNQSMTHKEAHAKYMAEILTEKLGVNFEYDSRMD